MRSTSWVVALCVCAGLGIGSTARAQSVTPLTIHNVTLHEDTSTLTIVGVSFGTTPVVTVDGQPVTVLVGGTDTQLDVEAPATIWTTPGTYRLTVMDPARRQADAFVVASYVATLVSGGNALLPETGPTTPATALRGSGGGATTSPASQRAEGSVSAMLIEVGCVTGVGQLALALNTSGCQNTATGSGALYSNTTGSYNTATGHQALNSNNGGANTAVGAQALHRNTSGSLNTASGADTLLYNTTGSNNTAVGYGALAANTTADFNTAIGKYTLSSNLTGEENTASGSSALQENRTGSLNTASGVEALYLNNGWRNVAVGHSALWANNSGGLNTAVGFEAGRYATTGFYNVYLGASVGGTAGDTNTMRLGLAYDAINGYGQNRTFVAGIYGTAITAGVPVVVDANGQLGVAAPPSTGGVTPAVVPASGMSAVEREQMAALTATVQAQAQQLRDQQTENAEQQTTIAALQVRLARLETLLPRGRK